MTEQPKRRRGFAAMPEYEHRVLASEGGKAVARNREHMREIGRRGGKAQRRKAVTS